MAGDSNAGLLIEVLFQTGFSGNQPRMIKIPAHEYLQTINVEHKSMSAWTGTVTLFDAEGDFLENLVIAAGKDRVIQFRWGWNIDKLSNFPWYRGAITRYKPQFTPEGVTIEFELVGEKTYESIVNKKTRSFRGNVRASTIVEEIARDRGWKTDKDGQETIDKTDSPITYTQQWSKENDITILRELARKTVSQDGQAYNFWIDETNAVHFRPRNFSNKSESKRTYTFARDAFGEVASFEPTDDKLWSAVSGGDETDFVAIDSLAGVQLRKQTSTNQVPEGSRQVVASDSTHLTDLGKGTKARVPLIGRDEQTLSRQFKARYDAMFQLQTRASLAVHGTHGLGVFDFITVNYFKRNGKPHYLSGVYQIQNITHEISSSGWNTQLELFRPGHKYTDSSERLIPDRTVSVEQPADGGSSAPSGVSRHNVRE